MIPLHYVRVRMHSGSKRHGASWLSNPPQHSFLAPRGVHLAIHLRSFSVAAERGRKAGARSSVDSAVAARGEGRKSKPSAAVERSAAVKAAVTARKSEVTRLLGNCAGLRDAQFLIRALRRR